MSRRTRSALRLGRTTAGLLALFAIVSPAFAQTGEHPLFIDPPPIRLYEKASHWHWGPNDFLTQLEYVVFEPDFLGGTPRNGHGVVIPDSGGFGSDDGANLAVRVDTRNFVRAFVQRGYTVFIVSHGTALPPGTLPNDRVPAFIPAEIFPQVHNAVRDIRATQGFQGGPEKKLGAYGFSSGGALAISLAIEGTTGTTPLHGLTQTSRVDAAFMGGTVTDILHFRHGDSTSGIEDHALFFMIPEYFAHPDLSGVINPSTGVPWPSPPTTYTDHFYPSTLHNIVFDGTTNDARKRVHHSFWGSGFPDVFPQLNWDENANGGLGDLLPPDQGPVWPATGARQYPIIATADLPHLATMPMNVCSSLSNDAPPIFFHHGELDKLSDAHQYGLFVDKVNSLPPATPPATNFIDRFRPVFHLGRGHGGPDPDNELVTAALAWFDRHLAGFEDLDQDRLEDSSESLYGAAPLDPDTDGDGLLDGSEVTGTTVHSDPANPADGLRATSVYRPSFATNELRIGYQPSPAQTSVLQGSSSLLRFSADVPYEWTDLSVLSGIYPQNTFVIPFPTLSPGELRYYRVRRETAGFDHVAADPVGVACLPIYRYPSASRVNYLTPPLVQRDARGKVQSAVLDNATEATVTLAMPLAYDNQTPLIDLENHAEEYVLIVIRDPGYGPEVNWTLGKTTTTSQAPRPEETGMEGHWWKVVSSSGSSGPASGDTSIKVMRRSGFPTEPNLIPVGATVAVRRLSTLEDVLGPVGGPSAPFIAGDEIEVYDGALVSPATTTKLTFNGTAWQDAQMANVSLSAYRLLPDEAFAYRAYMAPADSEYTMLGWVPMGEITSYIPGVLPSSGTSNFVKNWPYPVDCPEKIFDSGSVRTGLLDSGFTNEEICLIHIPWPDGSGPTPPITPNQGDDNPDLLATMSVEVAFSQGQYSKAPLLPIFWRFPGFDGQTTTLDHKQIVAYIVANFSGMTQPTAEALFDGPVLQHGRGRKLTRISDLGTGNPIEWKRIRPYSWRL